MYHGVKVLDVHSHIRPPATSRNFWFNVSAAGEKSMFSPTPPQSPIADGKHSDLPGLRDEDIKAAADSHAKYLEDRSIDTQIIGPHPHAMFGWFGSFAPHRFKSWIRFSNDLVFRKLGRDDGASAAAFLAEIEALEVDLAGAHGGDLSAIGIPWIELLAMSAAAVVIAVGSHVLAARVALRINPMEHIGQRQ